MTERLIETRLRSHPAVRDVLLRSVPQGESRRLVAYVVPRAQSSDLDQQRVRFWERIYDTIYSRDATSSPDPTMNIAGWTSSYDGRSIPASEMQCWVSDAVDRILAQAPRRVLEIGCGTGMLLFRLAGSCSEYCGTDISRKALRYIESVRNAGGANNGGCDEVSLLNVPAHDFSMIEPGRYDTLLLNSVVQYFPSEAYLTDVLANGAALLPDDGKIYVGDVRNLDLLTALHASVVLARAAPSDSFATFRQAVERALKRDSELVLAPAYFRSLPERLPAIRAVEVQLKRSPYDNELTRFRYEVILHRAERETIPDSARRRWSDLCSLTAVARVIEKESPDILHVCAVPNARLAPFARLAASLDSAAWPDVGAILSDIEAAVPDGIDPWSFVRLGRSLGYIVELHSMPNAPSELFDVVFHRFGPDEAAARPIPTAPPAAASTVLSNRAAPTDAHPLASQLRRFLASDVSSDMMPTFVVLADLADAPRELADGR